MPIFAEVRMSEFQPEEQPEEQPEDVSPTDVPTTEPLLPPAEEQEEVQQMPSRYYDAEERQIHLKDFPELIGYGPSGCLAVFVVVMLIIAIDPIFVGYGIIIGLIKDAVN